MTTKPIPIAAAERIAKSYGYDQVVVVARKVGGNEHVTTYGVDEANCGVAARIGNFFKHKLMGWPKEDIRVEDLQHLLRHGAGVGTYLTHGQARDIAVALMPYLDGRKKIEEF